MLELPQKFENDIQGNTTNLIPLVVIDNRLFLSTNELTLDNHYLPLISSVNSIKQSINTETKISNISSVSISIINKDYSGSMFSEQLFSPSIMNKKIEIFFKSQSAESIDDCLKVYTGYITDITENKLDIQIEAEDKSHDILSIDLPDNFVPDESNVPSRYYNKPLPIVYGFVEKAPCLYYQLYESSLELGQSKYSVVPDLFFLQDIKDLYIFTNNIYCKIKPQADLFEDESSNTMFESVNPTQYEIIASTIFIDKSVNVDEIIETSDGINSFDASPIGYNYVEVETISKLKFSNGKYYVRGTRNDLEDFMYEAKVGAYKNSDGTEISSHNDNEIYLMVKDWGNTPDYIESNKIWASGTPPVPTFEIDPTTQEKFDFLNGESVITFEVEPYVQDSNILKQLITRNTTDNQQTVDIHSRVSCFRNVECRFSNFNEYQQSNPVFFYKMNDITGELFDFQEQQTNATTMFEFQTMTTNDQQSEIKLSNDVTNNLLTMTQRRFQPLTSARTVLRPFGQRCNIDYIKISDFSLKRESVLNNFINYEIFADVFGRVDNQHNDFTSEIGSTNVLNVQTETTTQQTSSSSGGAY